MANYSRIKKVAPSRCCLVVAVGGNWRIEEGEVNHRSRRTGKLRRGVARRLDEENACENPTAQDCRLCLRSVETLKA